MTTVSPDRQAFDLSATALLGAAIALALLAFSIGDGPQPSRADARDAGPALPSAQAPTRADRAVDAIVPAGLAISLPIGITGPATRLLDRQHTVPRAPFADPDAAGESSEISVAPGREAATHL